MTESSTLPSSAPPKKGGGAFKTFLKRGFSTLILLSVLAAVYFSANAWVYIGVFTLFCGITSWEWVSMFRQSGVKVAGWLVLGAGVLYPLALGISLIAPKTGEMAQSGGLVLPFLLCLAAPAVVALTSFIWELRRPVEGKETFMAVAGAVLSFIYPVWLFSFSLFFLFSSSSETWATGEPQGLLVFLWIFIVTKIMDIGAYISGSLFGRHRMIPHISPNKTWEGFLGACVITVLTGFGLAALFWGDQAPIPFSCWQFGVAVLFLGLFSVVGDLAGSLIKRALGVKDSGKLLPGIGGVFDLIDSPAFTFPVAFIAIICLHI